MKLKNEHNFMRISKNCIVNIEHIKAILILVKQEV